MLIDTLVSRIYVVRLSIVVPLLVIAMERTSPRAFLPFMITPVYFIVIREPILQSIHLISASSWASPHFVTRLKTFDDQFCTVMYWILAPLSAIHSTTA